MSETAGRFSNVECRWDGKAVLVTCDVIRTHNNANAPLRTPVEIKIETRYADPADNGEHRAVKFDITRASGSISQSDLQWLHERVESWTALDALVRRWAWRNRPARP